MSLPEHLNDREFGKFREQAGGPGEAAVAVVNRDGSQIGGSGGTAMLDDAAFTPGGSSVTPAGFLADDVAPDAVDEGDIGAGRMRRTTRAQYVELMDSAGNEVVALERGAANFATGQVSVGATATQIAASRATRRDITVVNHGTTEVFLGASGVTTTTGLKLEGVDGASVTLSITGALHGIVASGSQTVSFIEVYD